jgi:hypothetical protein
VDANAAFFRRTAWCSFPSAGVATRRAHLDQPRDIYGVLEEYPGK